MSTAVGEASEAPMWGLMAEFSSATEIVAAAEAAHHAGYTCMDAYSPYPIEELSEALELPHTRLGWLVLAGGLSGAAAGYGLAFWTSVIEYPLNVGGRPFHSWPAFIPVTFETTILFAAATAVFGMLALNGLPQPYHPVFNVERFALASNDRFFLCIEARDPRYDEEGVRKFLEGLGPQSISEVEP